MNSERKETEIFPDAAANLDHSDEKGIQVVSEPSTCNNQKSEDTILENSNSSVHSRTAKHKQISVGCNNTQCNDFESDGGMDSQISSSSDNATQG